MIDPALPAAALVLPAVVFAASDAATKTIPVWLTLPALGGALLGWGLGLWPWHPVSAVLAFVAFRLASLPAGDQKAVGVVAGFLAPWWACVAVLITFSLGAALLALGRWRDWNTAEWPFFPWVAAAVLCARLLA